MHEDGEEIASDSEDIEDHPADSDSDDVPLAKVISTHRDSGEEWVEGRREYERVEGWGASMQFYLLATMLPGTSGSEMCYLELSVEC